jgi:tRNA(Ile)-lysidine synthase
VSGVFVKKVKDAIDKHGMLDRGDHVVVAISGGPDSMALLRVMEMLSKTYGISLVMAHLNHCLRGAESEQDEQFVREVAKRRSIPLVCDRIDIPALRLRKGGCLEEVARQERYKFLNTVLSRQGANRLALGHHRDDQVETLIMNFLRGSGISGLKGMLPVRDGKVIRPMLSCGKEEIFAFLKAEDLPYVIDSTNSQEIYLRNRIRNQLIPELKCSYNPGLEECLSHTAELLRLDDDYIQACVADILSRWNVVKINGEIRMRVRDLLNLHEALQNRILREISRRLAPEGKGARYIHVRSLKNMLIHGHGIGPLYLPFGVEVRREYDDLVFARAPVTAGRFDSVCSTGVHSNHRHQQGAVHSFRYEVQIPGSSEVREAAMTIRFSIVDFIDKDIILKQTGDVVYMDYDLIIPPVILRNRIPGDRIEPQGLGGTKKIKACFIDEKVPRNQRWKVPLLVDVTSVLWIVGMRLSERVRISDKTRTFLKAEIV